MSDLAIISTYSVFLASYVVFALGKFQCELLSDLKDGRVE
jgi:hypothetical protein